VEVGKAETLPLEDGTVDLVFCWTALHWLDIPAFLAEAQVGGQAVYHG
jgi:ubiquinone/menaquinone biosynthesis C-methylase UbiE